MNLPSARNTTYTAASPVLSADIDDIQDCIVDSKHAVRENVIGAGGWQPKNAGPALGAGQWTATGIGNSFIADLGFIPVGDRIATVIWSYNNIGASGGVNLRVCRRKLDGTAEQILVNVLDDTTTGVQQNTQTYNYTIASGYAYYLQFDTGTNGQILIGASVHSDRL